MKVIGNCDVAQHPQNNMTMEILSIEKEKSKSQSTPVGLRRNAMKLFLWGSKK